LIFLDANLILLTLSKFRYFKVGWSRISHLSRNSQVERQRSRSAANQHGKKKETFETFERTSIYSSTNLTW